MGDISTDAMMREAAMMDASNNHVWARKVRRLCIERDKLQTQLAALPAAPAEDVRAGALKEAAEICDGLAVGYAKHKGAPMALADAKRDILALIHEAKP